VPRGEMCDRLINLLKAFAANTAKTT